MSKVILANRVDGNILLKGLIADGSLLTFSATGKFMGVRDMFSTPMADMQEVDVVSVLSQKGCVEIAFNINQIFSTIPASVENFMGKIRVLPGFLTYLKRDGNAEGIEYNQFIFVFNKGLITKERVMEVLGVNG